MYGCAEICQHPGQPSAGEHHKYELVFIVFVKLVVLFLVFFVEFAAACSSYNTGLTAASARAATSGRADDDRCTGRRGSSACGGDTLNVNTTVPSSRQLCLKLCHYRINTFGSGCATTPGQCS